MLVEYDFEDTARTLDELCIGIKSVFEVDRQTGGPGLVVSNVAIFDGDVH